MSKLFNQQVLFLLSCVGGFWVFCFFFWFVFWWGFFFLVVVGGGGHWFGVGGGCFSIEAGHESNLRQKRGQQKGEEPSADLCYFYILRRLEIYFAADDDDDDDGDDEGLLEEREYFLGRRKNSPFGTISTPLHKMSHSPAEKRHICSEMCPIHSSHVNTC